MKIVKSSCSSKRKVRTCTFSPQVNIKNKRTAVQTEQDVNAAHSEAKLQDLINDIKSNIYTKVKAVATSPEFGFDENEVDDYFFVEVSATEIGEDHHEAIRVEVRGEVSYEGLEDLMEALNPIIESYDSYAYFEPVEPGIIEAYVSVNQVDMSIYGATASPDHMFYDYHGKRFSVHDNSSEIGEDNIDDVYFLWKGSISQQAGAYNDADEDYVYAFIRGRGVIEYYKKGKYVATDNYTLRDEDDFEYAWEYMEIILQHICDRLIAYNKDVPDRMVYNSTSIQAADDEFHGYADVASDIESALKDGIHQFFQSDKYNWSDDQIQDKTVVDVAWAVLRDDKGVERHSLIIDVYAEANRRIIERLGRFLDQLVLSKYDSYDKFTWVDQYSIEGLVYLDEYLEDIESYTSIEASDDDEFHGYADVASSIDQDTKNCLTQFFGSAPYDWSSDDIKDRTVVDIAWAVIKDNDGYDRHSLIVDVYAEANRRTITKLGKLLDKQVLSKYESFDKFLWVDQYSIEGIVYLDLFSEDVNSSTSIQSSDSYEYDGANYEFVTNIDGYWVYRAVVDGKGTWRAMPQGSDESEFSRLSFPISYDQARGFEPINEPSAITKLRKDLGKKLLSKSGRSVEATTEYLDIGGILGEPNARYSSEDLRSIYEEGKHHDPLISIYEKGKHHDPLISQYHSYESWFKDIEQYLYEIYSDTEDITSSTDDKVFIEDIIDSLEDNGYDLSRIRSIRQGLLKLFGYKGKDADIIIHDLVAGGFIDPNDWVDKDYTPGIYSATNDGDGYWFFTTHGVQPGSVPRDVDILDIIDTPNGSFVKFNRFLSTKELNEYDMVEKSPKSVMSAEADELRSEDDHWVQEIEWAMSDLPSWFKVKGDNLHYKVTYNNQTVDVEFSVYDIAKYTYYINSDGPYTTNQAERIGEDIENYIDGTDVDDIFSDTEEDEEDLPMVDQEYDSAATSINSNKLPAIYKMVNFNEGDVVVDFGGGKFDNAVEYIRDKGATLCVYDPYNRSAEHNKEVLRILRENGGADAAVNSNVLNVIKEPEARKNVLENIARITKPGAPIYITVYEGKGNGQEGPTKSGYQLNRKTADYLEEIQEVFPDATRRGKLITAHNSGSVSSATDIQAANNTSYETYLLNQVGSLLIDKLESEYDIEFFITDMYIDGDDMHIQVYGDDSLHGDVDIPVDYSGDVYDFADDAFNKLKDIFQNNSSNTVEGSQDISRYDKEIVSYRKIISKSVEDNDDFLTDYTMYEVVTEDGSVEYECYFGDNDMYGPWNGEGLDFFSEDYDEAVEWYNSYSSDEIEASESIEEAQWSNDYNGFEVDDITSSTILDANPEFRNNFEEAIDFFYESYPATVELTDEVDEDYDTLYKAYVRETGSLYQQTPGIVYIDINWDSGEILQALQETAEAIGIEQYPDNIESSEPVEGDAFSQLEDQYLSPPEYDDPIEHEDSEELVEVELNQIITVDVDGDYEWDDDTYVWASPDGSNEEWRSEDGVYIDDKVGVVEHIDDLITPNVPTRPGKYRVTGLAKLIYDVSGIQEYRTNYGPDDYESDLDMDHAVVSFNFSKSSVENLKITPVRR